MLYDIIYVFKEKIMEKMIMEIRNARNFQLIDKIEFKNKRQYKRLCKKLYKIVKKHYNNNDDKEFLVRETRNTYLVKSCNYGYIIGIRKEKN